MTENDREEPVYGPYILPPASGRYRRCTCDIGNLCTIYGIIGYAYGHKQLERAAYRWNAELSEYLDSRVTSKGIGKRMLLVLLELLKAQGVHTVYSLVTSPNVKSDAMHNGCGFRTMGVCKNTGYKSGKWHDVTWYEKALLPYEDVPAEMIPIGEMEKETVDKILASF